MEEVKPIIPNGWLFNRIINYTPLVSIDLIIKNSIGEYLLNLRGRHPAYHKWFFFGGSIKKPEKPRDAFIRICNREFFKRIKVDFKDAKLTKLAVHQYKENRSSYVNKIENGIQYFVLCYEYEIDIPESELVILMTEYEKKVNKKLINKIKKLLRIKIEPEVLDIKWYSEEELMQEINVHENVKHYFDNDPNTIIATSLIPPKTNEEVAESPSKDEADLKDLLMLYQAQTKSINSYTTVIWAFPIVFVLALGNIYMHFSESVLVMGLIAIFAYILQQAFIKHTIIHEALKNSLENIETSIRKQSQSIDKIMPDWSDANSRPKSHLVIKRFLNVFIFGYFVIVLFTLIFPHIHHTDSFFYKLLNYIIPNISEP